MNIYLIVAILSPLIWAFVYVFDKYVVSHRVKNVFCYAVIVGIVNLVFGLIIALFLDWNIEVKELIIPVLVGLFLGGQSYFYFFILKENDASYFASLIYIYPIGVSLLAYFFFGEMISVSGIIGMIFALWGVMMLYNRARKVNLLKGVWVIALIIVLICGFEFFIKVASYNLPLMNNLAISTMTNGLVVIPALFIRKVRKNFTKEINNFKWALIGESMTVLVMFTLYFAMLEMRAGVVATIGAIEPLAVLLFEKVGHRAFGGMVKDVRILPKLGAIILIVFGVTLLSVYGQLFI